MADTTRTTHCKCRARRARARVDDAERRGASARSWRPGVGVLQRAYVAPATSNGIPISPASARQSTPIGQHAAGPELEEPGGDGGTSPAIPTHVFYPAPRAQDRTTSRPEADAERTACQRIVWQVPSSTQGPPPSRADVPGGARPLRVRGPPAWRVDGKDPTPEVLRRARRPAFW
ncbi:hypothetical protein FOMPIDRAFT_1056559 [Fomitopsis schrenkii]|uniref:Uncharacterized protein n=1 Tax=Fomitopsis schrenkii TaxID=2126942 RepID=S8F186_FOMSC|nr:hypothetical protein FOMPIDRAFT_1056559 [Fomitopsis schrenkii]